MGKAPSTKSATRPQKACTAKTSQAARNVKQASMKARSRVSSSKARDSKQREQLDDMLSQLQQGGEERPNPVRISYVTDR